MVFRAVFAAPDLGLPLPAGLSAECQHFTVLPPCRVGPSTSPPPFLYPVLLFPMFPWLPALQAPCPQSSFISSLLGIPTAKPRSSPPRPPAVAISGTRVKPGSQAFDSCLSRVLPIVAALFFPTRGSDHVTPAPVVPDCFPNKVGPSLLVIQGPLQCDPPSIFPALSLVTSLLVPMLQRGGLTQHCYPNRFHAPQPSCWCSCFLLSTIPSPNL